MIFGVSELCQQIKRGEDVSEALEKIEPQLKQFCEKRDTAFMSEHFLCAEDALYEVSPSIQTYWHTIYDKIEDPKEKYQALLRFVNAREQYLGKTHIESVHILRKCGWTALDVMATYMYHRVYISRLNLSPDVAEEAAKEDWDTALQLLEGKYYDVLFPFLDKSYYIYHQFEWIDFLYCFVGYQEESFLRTKHKSKRLCKYCEQMLERLSVVPQITEIAQESNDCPDFSVFDDMVLQQKHLMRSAARQKLRKGNQQNGYYVMSFHFVDEQLGCGAALCFDPINKSSDYGDRSTKAKGVYFYRFTHLYLSDDIPKSRQQAPEDMPETFVQKAYHVFALTAGLRKNK